MIKLIDRQGTSNQLHWGTIVLLSWLSMAIGLFTATVVGQWARFAGATDTAVLFIQALVASMLIVPAIFGIQHRFGIKLKLLPMSVRGLLHFLGGFGLAVILVVVGLLVAVSQQWIVITSWHLTTDLLVAVLGNLFIALLYEALPEELSLRGLVYSGLRTRLPVLLAYIGQMMLFVLVPIVVVSLQRLIGITQGGTITVEYVILLMCFGLALQLWRSLTGSLWASIGFHLAYLEISRFVIIPRDMSAITYIEEEAGTGELFVLFGMVIVGAVVVLVLLNAAKRLRARKRKEES